MRDKFVISDTHFNHANILGFKNADGSSVRDFSSVEEMNEIMIERWNSVVKPGDIIYHLGDVFFGSKDWFKENWPRLNGSKRLIPGNHDDIPFLSSGAFFKKVVMWRMFSDLGFLLTHVPVHESTLREGRFGSVPMVNIHGHIHGNSSPSPKYINVSVEKINYTPISLEELRDRI
jgi:calcineurin-like phosphoesterase family protein